MRISQNMIFDALQSSVQSAQNRAFAATERASSGRAIERFSDDPVRAASGRQHQYALDKLQGMEKASRRIAGEQRGAANALEETRNILVRAKEINIQGINGSLSDSERQTLAAEVESMRTAALALGNTQIGETYIFGGNQSDQAPFASDGSYSGDAGERRVEVAPGQTVAANIPGARAFGTGAATGDVFAALDGLAGALQANSPAALQDALDALDAASGTVADARSDIETHIKATRDADARRESLSLELQRARSDALEQDPVQAIMDMLEAQSSLQSAIAQASRIMQGLESGSRL